jgi:UDP-N-acetyl-D-mannosaminuronic acid dehydrogenase
MAFSTVSVIGLGYIGLPTAAMFSLNGVRVIGVDVSHHVVETINRGEIHIVEPDLDAAVHHVVAQDMLRASTQAEPAEAFLIAVPTPFKGESREPDLSYVESAARMIAPVLASGNLVVLESTSPVGATDKLAEWLAQLRPDLTFPQEADTQADVMIAHCPERVLPGRVMVELIENDRIIGGMTPRCAEHAKALYETFVKGECVLTTTRTAEMAKLAENSFRDVNIAFANELSLLCDRLGVNVWDLIKAANRHPRVNILQPGPGVGGHCIAVDPWFLVASAPDLARLIRTGREVNDGKPHHVVAKVEEAAIAHPDLPIFCYGLAFKADIDDLRESPSLEIARILADQYAARLHIVEPNIAALPIGLEDTTFHQEPPTARGIHLMLVDHSAFRKAEVPDGIIIDTRGVWASA